MQTFDFRYLRYFIAVAEELNFTRAAERLHTVQPSLSQQIRRLETEIVGTPLFWRQKYHLQLSAAGKVLLVEAKKILQQVDEALEATRRAARAESGNLVLSFFPGAEGRFKDFMLRVHAGYPNIHFCIRSLQSSEQVQALGDGNVDLGFIAGPISDEAIQTELVDRQKIVAILPSTHRLAKMKTVPIKELSAWSLVLPGRHVSSFTRLIDEVAKQNNVKFTTAVEVDNVLAAVNEVANGAGVGLVPEYGTYLLPKGLVSRPLQMKTQPTLDLFLAYRSDNLSPALQLIVREFHEYMLSKSREQERSAQSAEDRHSHPHQDPHAALSVENGSE